MVRRGVVTFLASMLVVACGGGAKVMGPRAADGVASVPPSVGGVAADDEGPPRDMRLAMNDPPAGSAVVKDAPHDPQFLVHTATLTLSVYQVDEGLSNVERMARELGGYLSVRNDQSVTVRVPRARFREILGRVEQMGNVVHRSVAAEDVNDPYVDMEIRLKNARGMRDRLQGLLASAGVKEALDIEKELVRVTQEIEGLEGKLKLLRDRIAFSTVTVSFMPLDAQQIKDAQLIAPFPWLGDLGLSPLLRVWQ